MEKLLAPTTATRGTGPSSWRPTRLLYASHHPSDPAATRGATKGGREPVPTLLCLSAAFLPAPKQRANTQGFSTCCSHPSPECLLPPFLRRCLSQNHSSSSSPLALPVSTV